MANSAYSVLADWFEYLNDDCGYEEWSQYLLSVLRENGAGRTGVDLGCGSGYFTRALQKNGYTVCGLDVSAEMLNKASALSSEAGVFPVYLLADVCSFRLAKRVDFAVSVNDCFNYVPKDKLVCAFTHVAGALKKGGLFFFDVSSEKKLRSFPPLSLDDREDITYLDYREREGDSVRIEVSLFIKGSDGKYVRYDERHVQYIYTVSEILSALGEAGFEVLRVSAREGEVENADRIQFLAKRK